MNDIFSINVDTNVMFTKSLNHFKQSSSYVLLIVVPIQISKIETVLINFLKRLNIKL